MGRMIKNLDEGYRHELAHLIEHMSGYIQEATNSPSAYRVEELKMRFSYLKKFAYTIFADAFELVTILDGETAKNVDYYWNQEIESKKAFYRYKKEPLGDYSMERLHPVRHIEEYQLEVYEGDVSPQRMVELKARLGLAMDLAVRMYYDSENIMLKLDE